MQPHTAAWYDRPALLQSGYYYPWRSRLGVGNGEDAYAAAVREHLCPTADVLDSCVQPRTCLIAPAGMVRSPSYCRSVLGYDRVLPWIERARHTAHERGIANATFIHHDSAPQANGGRAHLPVPDASYDVLICRRGPFHWVEDARRVGRPGAVLLMFVPNPTPATPWSTWLPGPLGWANRDEPLWAREAITERLLPSGLTIDRYWTFLVPEIFPTPEDAYGWRAWGYAAEEVASYEEVRPTLERIFLEYGDTNGVAVPHSRFLWKASIPG